MKIEIFSVNSRKFQIHRSYKDTSYFSLSIFDYFTVTTCKMYTPIHLSCKLGHSFQLLKYNWIPCVKTKRLFTTLLISVKISLKL